MDIRNKRLLKNTAYVFAGQAGSSLVAMILLPFYTHWLSAEQYGIVDVVNTYSLIVSGFVGCCITDAIFVYPTGNSLNKQKGYFTGGFLFLLVSCIISGFIFLLICFFSKKFNIENSFVLQLWFIYGMVISKLFQLYSQQFIRAIDKMQIYSITGIIQTVILSVMSILLIPMYGTNGYLWAIILSNILPTIYTIFQAKLYSFISFQQFSKSKVKELLYYGMPLIPNGLMWWAVNGLNRPFVDKYLGLEAVGLFAVASKFPAVLNLLCSIFSTAWSINIIEEFSSPDFNRYFNNTLKHVFCVSIFMGIIISIFSPVILYILADESYYNCWRLIPTLTFGVILQNFSSQIGGIFMANKKSKYFLYSSLWSGLSSLFATYYGVKYFGLQGAAWAIVFSFLVMSAVRLIYAWKYINQIKLIYYLSMCLTYLLATEVLISELAPCLKTCTIITLFSFLIYYNLPSVLIICKNITNKLKHI